MKKLLTYCVVILLVACNADSNKSSSEQNNQITKQQDAEKNLVRFLVNDFFLPKSQAFAVNAGIFETRAKGFCLEPTAQSQQTLQDAWKRLALSWAPLQYAKFGALQKSFSDNTYVSIQFWPVKPVGDSYIKVGELVASHTPLNTHTIQTQSSLAKGLTALEYLVYLPLGDLTALRACQLLTLTSDDLRVRAETVASDWRATYKTKYLAATPNAEFSDATAVLEPMIEGLWTGVELLENDKLEKPLGAGSPKPALLETSFALLNLAMIKENLNTLQYLLEADNGIFDYLSAKNNFELTKRLQGEIQRSQVAANALSKDLLPILENSATDPEFVKLQTLHSETNKLLRSIKYDLSKAMGVSVGLNSSDGDF